MRNLVTGEIIVEKADFNKALDEYLDAFPKEVAKALYQEGQNIMRTSKKLCPVDTGKLRASGRVMPPQRSKDGGIYVDLVYNANYAVYVHENMEAYHKPPTRAKFLEIPAREAMPRLIKNVVERTNNIRLKQGAKK